MYVYTVILLYVHIDELICIPQILKRISDLFIHFQYSFQVIPKVGELVAGDAESYQYLVESIRRFPKQVFSLLIG